MRPLFSKIVETASHKLSPSGATFLLLSAVWAISQTHADVVGGNLLNSALFQRRVYYSLTP
ncbi:hypothetical protein CCE29_07640 [Lacticaseibacillus rhamnosus]|uniref:Uncharacterized protein n=1 Tax=Lacticaseibacillus rhamnosus TaxID=47715 RepID=A0AAX0K016_LACRH|nr:hypothetical protein B4583_12185 [Lacticaseibacillus rhamnosus]ASY48803.1 hypothetical protein N507_1628 [Lacticaseibacillus rhamnosus DSM 14870]AXI95672.1 hypothetical protein DU507_14925 [Lacticaseibacillus rhamnosus GG]ART95833.1 hypothetical protein CCE29_07640 [Lacticaseibacillus rhamnosus]AZZ24338.1 hypothetical protein CYG41_14895 [Lacticaseibacillus rhamnosus]